MIFSIFISGRELKKLKKQFAELADKLQMLQSQLGEMRQEFRNNTNIENVYVEQINVDMLEFSNNFGAMGIKELGGTLNIGVNCPTPPKEKREAKAPPSKRQPSPGNKTADPNQDQGNSTRPFSKETQVKQNCPDDLKESSDANKEASPNKKQQNYNKDINNTIKSPKKQTEPECNVYFGE